MYWHIVFVCIVIVKLSHFRVSLSAVLLVIVICAASSVASCGQTGSLYLPNRIPVQEGLPPPMFLISGNPSKLQDSDTTGDIDTKDNTSDIPNK